VNTWDLIPILLLLLLSLAFTSGSVMLLLVSRARRHRLHSRPPSPEYIGQPLYRVRSLCPLLRPPAWLAIKSRNLLAVQSALGLHHAKPCFWTDGLAGEDKLFIAPPVRGWILVMGSGLPDPSDDVDACFRFVLGLSRKLGQVQFFSASRILHHHAWVRAERGHVVRAYAWAGKTIWKQGLTTAAEKELRLKCFEYADPPQTTLFGEPEGIAANVDRLPLLAARWSLDPGEIDERFLQHERGIAGEPSRRF